MSQENVEVAREAYTRFQAGDPAWSDWVHPEIEWDFSGNPLADLPNRGRGRDALLKEVIETYFSGWIDYHGEITETVDAGDDVVVMIHERVRMRDSDAVLERDLAHVWTIRDRQWVYWRIYPDWDSALEAVGPSE
jgi:ketosteroid isomerase-like protein